MDALRAVVRLKFWLYSKFRIGVYSLSVPLKLRKSAVCIEQQLHSDFSALKVNHSSLFFEAKWLEELNKCYKFGGYRKFLGKHYWSHRKFKYFDFQLNVFDGVPNFIKSANFLKVVNILYFPHAIRPNEVSKYTFKVKQLESNDFEIQDAISFNLGGADSFQHFVQDCLPIILISKKFLNSRSDLVILLPPANFNFKTRTELIRSLGITNKIVETGDKSISIGNLYYWNFEPFNAKYALPAAWTSNLFNAVRKTSTVHDEIILITRNEETRNFANLKMIISVLNQLADDLNLKFKVMDSSTAKLSDYREEIPKAKVVVSMHGGANYNLLFASEKTIFFEFIPMKETNSLINFFKDSGITYIPVPIDFKFKQSEEVFIPEIKLIEVTEIAKGIIGFSD